VAATPAEIKIMTQKIPESQTDQQLPMVVFLRGDEEWVEDFQVDAEEAMDLLGIKRSRLTQISGRELRVGRIRRDRYIRPVYRLKDLEDYQSWTRSTASHQSSSLLIEQVIDRVEQQCRQLEDTAIGPYRRSLEEGLGRLFGEFKLLSGHLLGQLTTHQRWQQRKWAEQPDLWFRLQAPLSTLEKALVELRDWLQKDLGHVQEVQSALHKDLVELLSYSKRLSLKVDEALHAGRADLERALLGQQEGFTQLVQQQDLAWQNHLDEMYKHFSARLIEVESRTDRAQEQSCPRPKRRIPRKQRLQHQVFGGVTS